MTYRVASPAIKIITPPTSEQIDLATARLQLSLDDDGDSPPSHPLDSLIADAITAAREYCEDYLGLALAPQTVELALDSFIAGCQSGSAAIELPMPPVTGIVSVTYVDADSVEQEMDAADYVLDDYQMPSWILPAYGTSWPTPKAVINAVKIRVTCGYSIRGDSPETHPLPGKYRQAMLVLMTDMVTNRTGTPGEEAKRAAESLMALGRIRLGV